MAALFKGILSSVQSTIARRSISTSAVHCEVTAGRYKRSKNHDKPITYEEINAPYQIHHRKGWCTWNTSNLLDGIRSSQCVVEDYFIRKFMFGTWHRIFVSDPVIIKRRHNQIIITGIIQRTVQVRKLYFLIGYTEEMLSYIFKCPVKIELQSVANKKDIVFKYV
ncbi:hypothetical protein JTE90_019809 [Oedothorax gibbosus]|uniref:28S ribosomal protein S24, mitochondrial n=1 Tax=Oedothorax gibbosus TaxID=931172 RepID=A0AAV6V7F9_9ARAC|nr:hypothetical protein JTE90_019809 [Oedothorax gibbosus]